MVDCFQGCQRGKLGKQIGGSGLVNMLGPDNILQATLPHIAQLYPVWKPVLNEIVRRLRKQDLAAVPHGHDPLRQRQRGISFIGCALWVMLHLCGAGMNAHPHLNWRRRPSFLL